MLRPLFFRVPGPTTEALNAGNQPMTGANTPPRSPPPRPPSPGSPAARTPSATPPVSPTLSARRPQLPARTARPLPPGWPRRHPPRRQPGLGRQRQSPDRRRLRDCAAPAHWQPDRSEHLTRPASCPDCPTWAHPTTATCRHWSSRCAAGVAELVVPRGCRRSAWGRRSWVRPRWVEGESVGPGHDYELDGSLRETGRVLPRDADRALEPEAQDLALAVLSVASRLALGKALTQRKVVGLPRGPAARLRPQQAI